MAGVNRSTYFEPHEDAAVVSISKDRRWSVSRTIAELVREAKTFRDASDKARGLDKRRKRGAAC